MDWIQMMVSLAGVIGLILFLFYLLRKVNKRTAASSGSKLRIIDRANTGRDSALLVISVCGKLMLVGVSVGKIEKLCNLDISEEEYFGAPDEETASALKFADVLGGFMNLKAKKRQNAETDTDDGNRLQGEGEDLTVEPENKESIKGEGF